MPPKSAAKPIMDVQPPAAPHEAALPPKPPEAVPAAAPSSSAKPTVPKPPRGSSLTGVITVTIVVALGLAGLAVYMYYRQTYPARTSANAAYNY